MINPSRCTHCVTHGTTKQARNDRGILYRLTACFRRTLVLLASRWHQALTVAISDELSEEERAIMIFLKRYFNSAAMPNALWILNESENILDVRALIGMLRLVLSRHGRVGLLATLFSL